MTTFILQWNINGLACHLEKLKVLLSKLSPIIVCIQETNFKNNHHHQLKYYRCVFKNRTGVDRASGGVATYVREDFVSDEIHLTSDMEAVAVHVQAGSRKLSVVNMYIPPNRHFTISELQEVARQVPSPKILLGDFNSDNVLWGSTRTGRRGQVLEEFIESNSMVVLNTGQGTRFNTTTGSTSCIDLTISEARLSPLFTWQPMPYLYSSDHFPICIEYHGLPQNDGAAAERKWNYKAADWSNFSAFIETNLPQLKLSNDIEHDLRKFEDLIRKSADLHVGDVGYPKHGHPVPWWNSECQNAMRASKTAFYKARRSPTPENLIEYKRLRARARFIFKKSKRESWENFVSSITSSTSSAVVWDKIRRLMGAKKQQNITVITQNNNTVTSPTELAELFAEHFSKTASDMNYDSQFLQFKNQAEQNVIDTHEAYPEDPLNYPVSLCELEDALCSCKNSAPGPDNIPFLFIKHFPPVAKHFLLEYYNKIFLSHQFPRTWSQSLILPFIKPNKPKDDVSSYRPISLTNAICKLLEKILNARLIWHLENNSFLTNYQCGFRKNRSSIDNIVSLESEIHEAFANKQKLLAVFFDIEKAFDLTWRYKIMTTLMDWGIKGSICAFIQNFLSNRSFKAKVNGQFSNNKVLQNGIPQGSILSTTLFLVSINDIFVNIDRPVQASLFADDLVVYVRGINVKSLMDVTQRTLDKLEAWCSTTGFKFSKDKTKCILFDRSRYQNPSSTLRLFSGPLEFVHHTKYLGVMFDSKLNWKMHFDHLKQNCTKALSILRVLSHHSWGADISSLLKIHQSMIRSRIDYGLQATSSARRSYLRKVQTIENQSLRIITRAFPTTPIESLFSLVGVSPVSDRIPLITLQYACKFLSSSANFNKKKCPCR